MNPILIIEDEHALAGALAIICRRLGRDSVLCSSGHQGIQSLTQSPFSLVILDIGLPDISGLDVLKQLRTLAPHCPAVVITAHSNLDNAVAAKQLGAAAYLVKPLDLHDLQETLTQLLSVNLPTPPTPVSLSQIVGTSPAIQRSFADIAHACSSDAPVLITGPTGTGKTLTARVIHTNGPRRESPFITLHCSALPETLLESELFGHEKNAFTGAGSARPGHIERAKGGTLFLDEIADISPAIQSKLLRFVEDRTFTRIGGREDLRVDLRLITATNKSLREEVRAGRFREDLYYRLDVLEIAIPSLAERGEDLPALVATFLAQLAPHRPTQLSPDSLAILQRHPWPGNIRELRNSLEYALAVSSGPVSLPHHLPKSLRLPSESPPQTDLPLQNALADWLQQKLRQGATYREIHDALESITLRHLLAHFGGKPTTLARETKMNRVTLRRKCRLLGESLPED